MVTDLSMTTVGILFPFDAGDHVTTRRERATPGQVRTSGPVLVPHLANLEEVDTGPVLSCERCQSRWEETDPVALAGLRSGYGVLCPGCRSVVMVQRQVVPQLRLLDAQTG